MRLTFFSIFFTCLATLLSAQQDRASKIALSYLQQQSTEWGLSSDDISEIRVSDAVYSKHNGVTHVYLIQQHDGTDIYNAISNFNIMPDGYVIGAFNGFYPDLSRKINTKQATISPEDALRSFLEHKGIFTKESLETALDSDGVHKIEGTSFARGEVLIKPMYMPYQDEIRLSWDISFDDAQSADYWSARVDATTGEVLDVHNFAVYCNMGSGHVHNPECQQSHSHNHTMEISTVETGSYNIFELPAESPLHADRTIVIDPSFPEASPLGWHNTVPLDGAPEYTITRGNNVHSYADRAGDDMISDPEPDGGQELDFNFVYDPALEPVDMIDAAITNLFYTNNMMHDITYLYGFDESAGNFQENNFENSGEGGDYVVAQGLDGSGTNNANFATPPDGGNGRMQMFLWNTSTSGVFFGESPESIQQPYNVGRTDGWGADIGATPVIGSLAVVDDDSQFPSFGCSEIENSDEVQGKVAFVDRGGCDFSLKAFNAQAAGAIGVIICNFEDGTVGMTDGSGIGAEVDIPVVMLSNGDCQPMRLLIESGEDVQVRFQSEDNNGPSQLAGSFDNGIIAHEYAHGISNRLTGGPSQAGCLSNDEQMGEGWSDFFTLITTVEPGDQGTDRRGIGNFASGGAIEGQGIRRAPYSTDIDIYPYTYRDIIGTTAPHPLGEVWAMALWDIYWALVDVYGYDPDWRNKESGNAIALQLVMDGMKFQPCGPGFVTGRTAILQADMANNQGANQCLIWEAFAKRGIGFNADQGLADDRNDLTEDFMPLPICLNKLTATKKLSKVVMTAIETTEVTITVSNFKTEVSTGVVLTDEVPSDLIVDAGSISNGGVLNGNTITWDIGDMASEEEVTVTYTVRVPANLYSDLIFADGFDNGEGNWLPEVPSTRPANGFFLDFEMSYEGSASYFIPNLDTESDGASRLFVPIQIDAEAPVMRFWQRYLTEPGVDGGIVEVTTDNGDSWEAITAEKIFRNGYNGPLDYGTFVLPNIQSWSGDSDGWIDSYIDLSAYQGEEIYVRFRFGTDDDNGVIGWWIDEIEFLDLLSYQWEACAISQEGEEACASFDGRGILLNTSLSTSVDEPTLGLSYELLPNPSSERVFLRIRSEETGRAQVRTLDMQGVSIAQKETQLGSSEVISFDVSGYSPGVYLMEIQTSRGTSIQKFIVQ